MKKLLYHVTILIGMLTCASGLAHDPASAPADPDTARLIQFPDTAHYRTMVLDPHTHSSFSDGHVWPRIRIEEALRDGLDAIAITEHLEWQPHLADVPHPDRNRAWEIAADAAREYPLVVVAGSEITRQGPAGHINALFITDANKLLRQYQPEDPADAIAYYRAMHGLPAQDAVDAAVAQEAFLFWNHPWWGDEFPDHIPVAPQFHIDNAANRKLHGIEIVNGDYYSEQAFQIALDLGLTLMGSSDIHELIDWDYRPHEGGHRPVTLVLSREHSQAGMREALFAGRTLVWYKNTLMAREPEMNELLNASLAITGASYAGDKKLLRVAIENRSDMDFQVKNSSTHTFSSNTDNLLLPQHAITELTVKTPEYLESIELSLELLNALVKPKQAATLTLSTSNIAIPAQQP